MILGAGKWAWRLALSWALESTGQFHSLGLTEHVSSLLLWSQEEY